EEVTNKQAAGFAEALQQTAITTHSGVPAEALKAATVDGRLEVSGYSKAAMLQTFGTTDLDLIKRLGEQLALASPKVPLNDTVNINSSLAALLELHPRNGLEGLIAVQLVA